MTEKAPSAACNPISRRLLEIMDTANVQIKRMILKAGAIETKAKYRRIAAELNKVREELKQNLYGQLELDFKELAEEETKFTKKALNDAGITIELGMPSPAHIWTAANFAPYIGSGKNYTYEQYLTSFSDDLYRVWDNELRAGYITGLTAKQIARNVLGSIEENDPGKMQGLRKSLEMNSRDALMEMGHMARKAVYDENDELFSGYKYLATLDSRTCPECFSVDGKVFKHIEDGPELLQHPRCRCLYLPVIKGMENVHGERAAQGGPVDSKMNFEEWIKTQPDSLVRDFLGSPTRFAAYKAGLPIKAFHEDGHWLSIKELMAKEGLELFGAGLKDKSWQAQRAYSDTYYESIRNRKNPTDIEKIAGNTGFSQRDIESIRNHVFIKEHDLGSGEYGRFGSDWQIAQAWQRMEQG